MEKVSFFISAFIAIQIFIIATICIRNIIVEYTVLQLPEKIKYAIEKSRKRMMSRSVLENLFLFLLLTACLKGIIMIIPWRI
jgi:hypothetical protein